MTRKTFFTGLGPIAGVGLYFFCREGLELDHVASMTAAVTALCAVWWSTEAIPIPVTSLLPFVLFPMSGVLTHSQLAGAWGDKFILLFMGGFMISRAAEKSNAHLRIAHWIIRWIGTDSNSRLIIGFMVATAFCSMWISNTATALIMLPVAMAVIRENPKHDQFAVSLLLAIAYGASIGGIATLIGTPPNGVMAAVYEKETGQTIDFLSWMKIGVPISVLMLGACAALLTFPVRGGGGYQVETLGPWTPGQRRMLAVIGGTALLWMTRQLPFGWGGWSVWLNMPHAHDATVALLAVLVMFLTPSGEMTAAGERDRLLDWDTARDIPWGILILFAGGLAIAMAFSTSGLAVRIGLGLQQATEGLPLICILILICFVVTFTTEVTSNTATTTLLMPVLAATASSSGMNPAILMIPAALSASCAFMLPVATPPNAIVFGGSPQITIPKMVRHGFALNLAGVLIIAGTCSLLLDSDYGLMKPEAAPVEKAEPVDGAETGLFYPGHGVGVRGAFSLSAQ